MDFVFVSMPYARFISKWFSNIPNINLGIMQAYLREKGKSVKTFHFHLEFLPYMKRLNSNIWDPFITSSEQFGVEYMGLDYVFASLLFEERYAASKNSFGERLESIGLTLDLFESLREVARSFIEFTYSRLAPYLEKTRLVGFSSSHYQISSSLLLCSLIKKNHPHIKTILGGKDCSGAFAYDLMKHFDFVDFVGFSECEITVDSLIEHIKDTDKEIFNVLFRASNNEIIKSKEAKNISLNSIPFPEYDFDDFTLEYNDVILPIEFGRGCPWKRCTFCPDESYNIQCQTKTSAKLQAEIEHYLGISNNLRNFFILDSDVLKNPKTLIELSHFLEGKNLNFHYAEFRADRMDRDVLKSILRFGNWISNFQIGIETFSERVLNLMNKGVSALKNVEVIKAVAELEVPIQFNLFTCFPGMTTDDMLDNNRVMDLITHLLVSKNIQIYPGEFYLPTDCPVFLRCEDFGIKKHNESIFSLIFVEFPLPSYSNYPYPYQFNNDDEQFRISEVIRAKVNEIKRKSSADNYMIYNVLSDDNLEINVCRDGRKAYFSLNGIEKDVYLSAIEKIQQIDKTSELLNIPLENLRLILHGFSEKEIILYSDDRRSFLSLATHSKKM